MCIAVMAKLVPLSFILYLILIAMLSQIMSGQHMNNKEHKRTQFTALQLDKLEKTFSQSQYVSARMRQSLSQQLGLSDSSIKVKR